MLSCSSFNRNVLFHGTLKNRWNDTHKYIWFLCVPALSGSYWGGTWQYWRFIMTGFCDSNHTPGKNTQTWVIKRRDLCIPTVNFVSCILIGVVHKYSCAHCLSLWSRGSKPCKFVLVLPFACIACQSLDVQRIFLCYPIFLPSNSKDFSYKIIIIM